MGRRGNSPSKFQSTPATGKGVQFESDTMEDDEKKRAKSDSTDPLETDSLSDDDANEMKEINDEGNLITTHMRVPCIEF